MPASRSQTTFLALFVSLWAGTAIGQEQREQSHWHSFGTFEITFTAPGGPSTARMIRFANGELMAEIESKGSKKQHLEVRPSRLVLYSGLSDDESPSPGGKNPFMFLDMAFAYPGLALNQAYPAGSSTVPTIKTEKEVVLERHPATLTTARDATGRVGFQLELRSDVATTIRGIWDGKLREPLPDSLPVATWRHDSSATVVTLGQARSLTAEQARSKAIR